jgi:hypothetical protein
MSKKPAELSANLVAIKGTATPAPDMHGRIAPTSASKAVPEVREELTPLNFRIPASFRREFKTYAATHDLKLNELLRRCFDVYRNTQRDPG